MSAPTDAPQQLRTKVELGGLYDLVVAFGSQARLKCANCTSYLPGSTTVWDVECRRCGTEYTQLESGMFKVVALP